MWKSRKINTKLPKISVVIPVKNGSNLLEACLTSLDNLNYSKTKLEIIVVDNHSTDDTRKIARRHRVHIINNPRYTVGSGRNAGFAAAKGELIAFTDADCTFDGNWLSNSVKYFADKRVGGVSGPNLVPQSEPVFSKAVGLVFDSAYLFNAGSPTKSYNQVFESRSHGSNCIFRRDALKQVFPMDETIVEGEDVIMTEQIEDAGSKLLYVPDVIVTHYRRSTPIRFANQMMRYAQAKVLLAKRHARQVTPTHIAVGWFLPVYSLIWILVAVNPLLINWWYVVHGIVFVGLVGYALALSQSLAVALYFPVTIAILLFAWSWGYCREFLTGTGKKLQDL